MQNPARYVEADFTPGSVGDIFRMIRDGSATSRSALARVTGLAPSTISLRVEQLEAAGLLAEIGPEKSTGGRRARQLTVAASYGVVAVADLGAHHVRMALADVTGTILATQEGPVDTAGGPELTARLLWENVLELTHSRGLTELDLKGTAIGLPGPIEYPSGRVILPSFMPNWHKSNLPELMSAYTQIPVLVENDANLLALGEYGAATGRQKPQHLLAVKLGTRIGCGIVSGGKLHRGAGGAAGEISHTAVNGTSTISCSCVSTNCLESVASGGALIPRLRELGFDLQSTNDVVALGSNAEPAAVKVLREAGAQIGGVLSSIVNFFNPNEVVLGGTLSSSSVLVAAIRAELFQQVLPLAADSLDIRASQNPADAGILGAINLILEELLAPARIERSVAELGTGTSKSA
ncbi:ROK family protein [Arthrobacter tumbae]|uniref:ROK family transcriptional regulator n=1 Tax=Arthrobacter tumbae TaxID=163874 RepID=UPI00195AA5A3|nr:ROK family transcriptional regulator [Arthrobacter tumbae]MBM7781750.1 putative NBD/HSP70 family sugar kinase [Arthrobacter tumbae]